MNRNHRATVGHCTLLLAILGLLFAGAGPASAEQKIYWSDDTRPAHIKKSNVDGSNVEIVIEQALTTALVKSIELDTAAGKIYWSDINANGFDELAVLGENAGVRHVQILDTKSGMQLNRIDFP